MNISNETLDQTVDMIGRNAELTRLVEIATAGADIYAPSFEQGARLSIEMHLAEETKDFESYGKFASDDQIPVSREARRKYYEGIKFGRIAAKAFMVGLESTREIE